MSQRARVSDRRPASPRPGPTFPPGPLAADGSAPAAPAMPPRQRYRHRAPPRPARPPRRPATAPADAPPPTSIPPTTPSPPPSPPPRPAPRPATRHRVPAPSPPSSTPPRAAAAHRAGHPRSRPHRGRARCSRRLLPDDPVEPAHDPRPPRPHPGYRPQPAPPSRALADGRSPPAHRHPPPELPFDERVVRSFPPNPTGPGTAGSRAERRTVADRPCPVT